MLSGGIKLIQKKLRASKLSKECICHNLGTAKGINLKTFRASITNTTVTATASTCDYDYDYLQLRLRLLITGTATNCDRDYMLL